MIKEDNSKFVIFDLDGTLVDSYDCVKRCVNKTLCELKLPFISFEEEEIERDVEIIFSKAREIILGKLDFTTFKLKFDETHLYDYIVGVRKIIEVETILKELICNGYHPIIITNKKENIAYRILSYFFPYLNYSLIGRTTISQIKSDAHYIINQLKRINCNYKKIDKFFGDSNIDFDLAKKLEISDFTLVKVKKNHFNYSTILEKKPIPYGD